MSENFITIPSSLEDEVKITREPLAGNGWGATVITVPAHIKVAFGETVRQELVEVFETKSPLSEDQVLLIRELVSEALTRESEYLVDKLHNGLKGETNNARLYVERREARLKKLESLLEFFQVENKR